MGTLPDYVFGKKDSDEVKEVCMKHVPFWDRLTHDDMVAEFISSAVTNRVFTVTLNPELKKKYMLNKVIIKKTTSFNSLMGDIDKQYEIVKFMSDNQCGPKLIGRFGVYTLQVWVEGTMMSNDSFQNLSVLAGLATSLSKLHKKCTEISPDHWDRTPFYVPLMSKWEQHLERVIAKLNLDFDHNDLKRDYKVVVDILEDHVKSSNSMANTIMFCHNDLFSLNILDTQHGVYLIDFDFSGFNYVGWEIANLFREITIVYDTGMPPYFMSDKNLELSYEFQSFFLSVYLSQLLDKNVLPSDKMVKEFIDSLEIHYLMVDVFWVFWGIIMKDRSREELNKPVQFEAYAALHNNLLKAQLKKLRDQKVVKY
ncbi:choline/ethanolamine kinase [Theileria orientalis strain Shintoku]|uniref:Choline/ethanolamine kinase n=1 Tax=Theileria orientalis strain Shintoku TaxID=869250 RepID=J4D7V2_THEOR|nr:choline/ethanolamine kinase [Theileria orientalis strain Shintoku]BAM40385.1 choline/ethanolamine kinase [Theileria orientalis strain Shintoku]|eukprot:XP_009690686.1 choline/ethanolamine kinase [Theileria orientalis strain Shintoku]